MTVIFLELLYSWICTCFIIEEIKVTCIVLGIVIRQKPLSKGFFNRKTPPMNQYDT